MKVKNDGITEKFGHTVLLLQFAILEQHAVLGIVCLSSVFNDQNYYGL
jgi:hypothetical protein